jgi:hypothetical protein
MIEKWVFPAQRLGITHRGKETGVLLVGDLIGSKFESIHPNAMHRFFIIAPSLGAHPEPTLRNAHHGGFDGPDPGRLGSCHGLSILVIPHKCLKTIPKS